MSSYQMLTLATVNCTQAPSGSQGTPRKKWISEARKGLTRTGREAESSHRGQRTLALVLG